jgi:hypothetical protein
MQDHILSISLQNAVRNTNTFRTQSICFGYVLGLMSYKKANTNTGNLSKYGYKYRLLTVESRWELE